MTYRSNKSSLGSPISGKLGRNLTSANRDMDRSSKQNRSSRHLQDQPAVTRNQNVFDDIEK